MWIVAAWIGHESSRKMIKIRLRLMKIKTWN